MPTHGRHTKTILLVVDPLPGGHSVQFELMRSIVLNLIGSFDVNVASIYINERRIKTLESLGVTVLSPGTTSLHLNRLLGPENRNNESMLWLESWLREAFFKRNTSDLNRAISSCQADYVINSTSTSAIEADIWWVQGPPLTATLVGMSKDNYLARLGTAFARPFIEKVDKKILKLIASRSRKCVASSGYVRNALGELDIKVDKVVHSLKDFSDFKPTTSSPSRDFILAYIGKETDMGPILTIAQKGVKIIGFGSKLPWGIKLEKLKERVDFKGYVSVPELKDLYSNALLTVFPFSTEGLGYVPLESMACGTPVLTYNRQGPAETVTNNVTGWLVENQDEFVAKALDIWRRGSTDILTSDCERAASMFDVAHSTEKLLSLLGRSGTCGS